MLSELEHDSKIRFSMWVEGEGVIEKTVLWSDGRFGIKKSHRIGWGAAGASIDLSPCCAVLLRAIRIVPVARSIFSRAGLAGSLGRFHHLSGSHKIFDGWIFFEI